MSKRYVDADILDGLAHNASRTRADLQELLGKCEGQVNGVVRHGWDQGAWWDARNALGSELSSLDDHGRALVNRASWVRQVAQSALQRWFAEEFAAVTRKIASDAAWLSRFWKDHVASLRLPVVPQSYMRGGEGGGFGPLVFMVTWSWEQALQMISSGNRSQRSSKTPITQGPRPNTITTTITAKEATQTQINSAEFVDKYTHPPNNKGVTDPDGWLPGECVSLVKRYVATVLPPKAKLGTFFDNTPHGEWDHQPHEAFGQGWRQDYAPPKDASGSYPQGAYQVGDIVFFKQDNHVGVVVSASDANGNFTVLESNVKGFGYGQGPNAEVVKQPCTIADTLGVMRYAP